MKRKYAFVLIGLFAASVAFAGVQEKLVGVIARKNAVACDGLLICQNFETATTGYDNSESWTQANTGTGSVDPDNQATVLRGSQSCLISAGDGNAQITSPTFTAQDEIHGHMLFKLSDGTPSSVFTLLTIYDSSNTVLARVRVSTSGTLVVYSGTSNSTGASVLSDATTYHLWWRYVKGTGANSIMTVWLASGTTTKPETAEKSVENGNATGQSDHINIYTAVTEVLAVDQILIGTSDIGNVDA